jgi:hypothetical protein
LEHFSLWEAKVGIPLRHFNGVNYYRHVLRFALRQRHGISSYAILPIISTGIRLNGGSIKVRHLSRKAKIGAGKNVFRNRVLSGFAIVCNGTYS